MASFDRFDFELKYGAIQWEAGSTPNDGGVGGLGGPNALHGKSFQFSARSGVVAEVPTSTVPEPGTWALLGTGRVGLAAVARRRRSA